MEALRSDQDTDAMWSIWTTIMHEAFVYATANAAAEQPRKHRVMHGMPSFDVIDDCSADFRTSVAQ
eukprot:6370232-Alexandrium_andersonii.AAC.1